MEPEHCPDCGYEVDICPMRDTRECLRRQVNDLREKLDTARKAIRVSSRELYRALENIR